MNVHSDFWQTKHLSISRQHKTAIVIKKLDDILNRDVFIERLLVWFSFFIILYIVRKMAIKTALLLHDLDSNSQIQYCHCLVSINNLDSDLTVHPCYMHAFWSFAR